MKFPVERRFESNNRVVKFLAFSAKDGFDDNIPAAIRATRDAGAITTSGTFEEVRATHKLFAESSLRATAGVAQFSELGYQQNQSWTAATCRRLQSADVSAHSQNSTCLYTIKAQTAALLACRVEARSFV
jgi:hypothetical protein